MTDDNQLILLGDLLDRGPDVLKIRDWLIANPEVLRVRGNHDDMLIATAGLEPMTDVANPWMLMRNGGKWIMDFAPAFNEPQHLLEALLGDDDPAQFLDPQIIDFARLMAQAPFAIEALTPGGKCMGFVHADVPGSSWVYLRNALCNANHEVARNAIWTRDRFNEVKSHFVQGHPLRRDCSVSGIDHVFFGHSITKYPMTHANCTWIDTGSYKHGVITVMDVDRRL